MNFTNQIELEITKSLKKLKISQQPVVEKSKAKGDYASNIALVLAKKINKNPLTIAEEIVKNLSHEMFEKIEIANPGFINFYILPSYFKNMVDKVNQKQNEFGKGTENKYLNVEFVSANPTGHLHVGHARGAVFGDVLINVLSFAGNKVDSEYYINDAGNQINILGVAVYTRYLQELGVNIEMPKDTYRGPEIIEVSKKFVEKYGDKYKNNKYEEISDLFEEEAKKILLQEIKDHLKQLGVVITIYSSEQEMIDSGFVHKTIDELGEKVYKHEGATWLKTTMKGDDKDRVLIKADGIFTYYGPDIGYHNSKLKRGYDKIIDIWGADHVGQVQKMKIAMSFLGYPDNSLEIPLIQMVKLLRDGQEVKMSKRAGTAYRLLDLVNEIGKDAARWFMISRSNESQFTLDLSSVNQKTKDNPLFFVQYAHARANQLINKSKAKNQDQKYFYNKAERDLILTLYDFPELVLTISKNFKLHLLPNYLINLARKFNSWYSNNKVIGTEKEVSLIELTKATKQVLFNGLKLLGVNQPKKM